jgi:AraC-like DNA-binding protein
VRNAEGDYSVLLFFAGEDACRERTLEYATAACERLAARLNITANFGVSQVSALATEAPALLAQARKAVSAQFYSAGPIIFYSEIACLDQEPLEELNGADLERDLEEKVFLGEAGGADAFLEKYLSGRHGAETEAYLKSLSFSIVNILSLKLRQKGLNSLGSQQGLWRRLKSFRRAEDLRKWLWGMIVTVQQHIEAQNNSRYASLVRTVREVVAARYMEPLTVPDIAAAVYLSPKQANAIFCKTVGCSIFDYLTAFRMDRAKELLKQTDAKISAVAEEVGYTNKSHFALIFKRCVGMTPAEYKSRPVL